MREEALLIAVEECEAAIVADTEERDVDQSVVPVDVSRVKDRGEFI